MSVFDWFLCAWMAFGALSTVALVGKPREPITPGMANVTLVVVGLLISGLLISRGLL